MNATAPPRPTAPAALLLVLALALMLAGALACAPSALASGALPWLAPGQQQNATDNATTNSTTTNNATAIQPAAQPQPPTLPPPLPGDPASKAQREVLRQYFQRQLTLADDFPEVFSRRVRQGEALAFQAMCEIERRRGVLGRFRAAQVDLSGLVFTHVTNDPDLARIRVTGSYTLTLGPKGAGEDGRVPRISAATEGPEEAPVQETLTEDALFVLLPEMGQWKIYERREGWRPWP